MYNETVFNYDRRTIVCIHTDVQIHLFMYIPMYIYLSVYVSIYLSILNVYIYIHIYIYVYIRLSYIHVGLQCEVGR